VSFSQSFDYTTVLLYMKLWYNHIDPEIKLLGFAHSHREEE
jgi:hypothetical protein